MTAYPEQTSALLEMNVYTIPAVPAAALQPLNREGC